MRQRPIRKDRVAIFADSRGGSGGDLSSNPAAARELVSRKELARRREQGFQQLHLSRLRTGNSESAATSSIHQEVLRELKQINTCFVMVAYPILTESGDLLETRLRRAEG